MPKGDSSKLKSTYLTANVAQSSDDVLVQRQRLQKVGQVDLAAGVGG